MAAGDEAYYPAEILSPSDADKLLNKKKHPQAEARANWWAALQVAITQTDGGKSLAKDTDRREAQAASPVEFGVTAEPV